MGETAYVTLHLLYLFRISVLHLASSTSPAGARPARSIP